MGAVTQLPRAFGRNLGDFGALGEAEQKLLENCRRGEEYVLSETRPTAEGKTVSNTVRAAFLRFLILGGDDASPIHEHGVRLAGAWISGVLDLNGVASSSDVSTRGCWFDQPPDLSDAHIKGNLILSGSRFPGLQGDRLLCDAVLFCNDGFVSQGEVRLMSARIGGNWECADATFNGPYNAKNEGGDALFADNIGVKGNAVLNGGFTANGTVRLAGGTFGGDLDCKHASLNGLLDAQNQRGNALSADRIDVKGNVFLNGRFNAKGTVRLVGATISGNLEASGATLKGPRDADKQRGDALSADNMDVKNDAFFDEDFTSDGAVRLVGATIGGNLECIGAHFSAGREGSLNAERLLVSGVFFFRELQAPASRANLAFTHVGVLADSLNAWGDDLSMTGFTYDRLDDDADRDAQNRVDYWLDKQSPQRCGRGGAGAQFRPQPWLQLHKVLRESGHAEDARQVGIALEKRRRLCGQITGFAKGLHWAYGLFTGYGYRPTRLLYWSLGIWLGCAGLYTIAAEQGVFVPTNAVAYDVSKCVPPPNKAQPTDLVFASPCGGHYTMFNALVYSLNVFLPVVALQQESAWSPSVNPPLSDWWRNFYQPFTSLGGFVQIVIWLETLFGWVAGLLLVAVVSGLARKQDDT